MQAYSLNVIAKKKSPNPCVNIFKFTSKFIKENSKFPNINFITHFSVFVLLFHFAVLLLVIRSPFYELLNYMSSPLVKHSYLWITRQSCHCELVLKSTLTPKVSYKVLQ